MNTHNNINTPKFTIPILKTHLMKDLSTCAEKIKFIKHMAQLDSNSSPKGVIYFPSHWVQKCPQELIELNQLQNYNVNLSENQPSIHWKRPGLTPKFPYFLNYTKRTITVETPTINT